MSGRMQMFIWNDAGSPTYQPDTDFDNGITDTSTHTVGQLV